MLSIARPSLSDSLTVPVNFPYIWCVQLSIHRSFVAVTETATQVEAEHFSINVACSVRPVPFVVERPHAAPPVEQAERIFFIEEPLNAALSHEAAASHAVDLLVVI